MEISYKASRRLENTTKGDSKVDRQNGIYTEILKFTNENIDISKIKKIGVYDQDDYKLLKNQAIKIDLK